LFLFFIFTTYCVLQVSSVLTSGRTSIHSVSGISQRIILLRSQELITPPPSNLELDQVANATHVEAESAKESCEIKSDTLSTTPPSLMPTTTVSAAPTTPLRPPSLKQAFRPPYSIYLPPNRISAETSHTMEPHPTKNQSRRTYPTSPPPFFSTQSPNHPSHGPSTSSWILTISLHQEDTFPPVTGCQHPKP
jgi:hypothetical protein